MAGIGKMRTNFRLSATQTNDAIKIDALFPMTAIQTQSNEWKNVIDAIVFPTKTGIIEGCNCPDITKGNIQFRNAFIDTLFSQLLQI